MTGLLQYSDEELMLELKAGNMTAFDLLYKKYNRKIYKFSNSILKSQEESENLLQDVFMCLWENRFKIEKDSSIKYYLFTVTYNSAITLLRKKAKESQFIENLRTLQDNTVTAVDVELEYNELTAKLDEIINGLPARQKEVYLLHKVEGLKYHEVAERLNISINTVENHMARALKTIRGKIGNYSLVSILFLYLQY